MNDSTTPQNPEQATENAVALPGPSASPLVATKLFVPKPPDRLLVRPRLAERLETAHKQSRLVLLTAPAGFGKTTAVTDWLHRYEVTTREKVAWFSIDDDDNDPIRFWEYFLAALDVIEPATSDKVRGLLYSQPPVPIEQIMAVIINHLANLSEPATLVLDDYHLISEPLIGRGIAYLLDHQPAWLRLVMTSRTEPTAPLPLPRLRVRGQLTELRAADLRFTIEETSQFFNEVMRLPMLPGNVTLLEAKTEGWIAALQLAALLMQSHRDADSFIKAFTGKQRFLLDYLAEEVLNHQPETIQHFLTQTSIVERFNAGLVEELTGCEDGQALLQQLERANLFLISLDEEQGWYRYHHLFRQYLLTRLERTQADHVPLLHRWAAHWYETQQMMAPAVEHALAAQDWSYAAQLIDQSTRHLYERGELRTLLRWLQTLPKQYINQRPHMNCNYAWVLILLNRPEAAIPYAEAEARGLTLLEASPDLPMPPEWIRAIRGEIAAIWAVINRSRGEFRRSIELGEEALPQILDSQIFLRCAIMVNQAICHLALEEAAVAEQEFREVERLGRLCDSGYFMLIGIISQGQIQCGQGRLQQAATTYRQALHYTELESLPVMSEAWLGLGRVQREQNELETAASSLKKAIGNLELGDNSSLPAAYAELARVLIAQNQLEEAQTYLDKAEQTARRLELPAGALLALAEGRVELGLARGELIGLERWTSPESQSQTQVQTQVQTQAQRESWQLLAARVQLAQGHLQEAGQAASAVLRTARPAERGRQTLAGLVTLIGSLCQQPARHEEAAPLLLEALRRGQPEGFVRVFLDSVSAFAEFLASQKMALITAGISSAYLAKLLGNLPQAVAPALTEQPPLPATAVPAPAQPKFKLVEPLTEREQAVLRWLVSTSLNSTEIADQMSVAVSTVRTHIKNIYSKLEVQSRLEAIQRSRDLDLL